MSGGWYPVDTGNDGVVSVTLPDSRPADAVTTLNVEPGK